MNPHVEIEMSGTLVIPDIETLSNLETLLLSHTFDSLTFVNNIISENLTPAKLDDLLAMMYPLVGKEINFRNTFRDEGNVKAKMKALDFHTAVLRNGFDEEEDFDRFMKPENSIVPFDFNYVTEFSSTKKLAKVNSYKVYNRVLGGAIDTAPYLLSKLRNPTSWIELMSGTAKAAFSVSHACPKLNILLVDNDPKSFDFNAAYPWGTFPKTLCADILKPKTYEQINKIVPRKGATIFIGKQSNCYFDYTQMTKLFELMTGAAENVILETLITTYDPQALNGEGVLTTAMSGKLGMDIVLKAMEPVNPITGSYIFDLIVRHKGKERTLFHYPWTVSPPLVLYNIAKTLNLKVSWFDDNREEFRPVEELTCSDVDDGEVNHLLFHRR